MAPLFQGRALQPGQWGGALGLIVAALSPASSENKVRQEGPSQQRRREQLWKEHGCVPPQATWLLPTALLNRSGVRALG